MYKCECGKEFEKANSLNAHKGHCLVHAKNIGKYDYFLEVQNKRHQTQLLNNIVRKDQTKVHNKVKQDQALEKWISEKHSCERCGKVMLTKFGSGRFCSRFCANSKKCSEDTRQKISESIKGKSYVVMENNKRHLVDDNQAQIVYYDNNPKLCIICNKVIPYSRRRRKTCCDECYNVAIVNSAQKAGKSSAQKRVLRSKNEIYFCELCEKYFKNVKHNEPIFNGWDADIIIEDIRYAILWNGPWHYRQITKKQSLSQIKTRDKIKLDEIKKCGYIPYIIKDDGKYDQKFVEEQFNLFISKSL